MTHATRLKSASEMINACQTCQAEIPADEEMFACFTCGCKMHLSEKCTKLSKTAIEGIKALGQNALLLCNLCITLKKRDRLIEAGTKLQQSAPAEDKRLKSLQSEVNEIKKALDEIKETVTSNPTAGQNNVGTAPGPEIVPARQAKGIRVRGIPESNAKSALQRQQHDMHEIKEMLNHMELECDITEVRRIGQQQQDRKRTVIFEVSNPWQRRLILNSTTKLKSYNGRQLYVSKELSQVEAKLEMELLKKRKERIDAGTQRNMIRIRDLKLYEKVGNDWTEIKLDVAD